MPSVGALHQGATSAGRCCTADTPTQLKDAGTGTSLQGCHCAVTCMQAALQRLQEPSCSPAGWQGTYKQTWTPHHSHQATNLQHSHGSSFYCSRALNLKLFFFYENCLSYENCPTYTNPCFSGPQTADGAAGNASLCRLACNCCPPALGT